MCYNGVKQKQVTTSPATITFTPQNYMTERTITVTAIDDSRWDGNETVEFATSAALARLTTPIPLRNVRL